MRPEDIDAPLFMISVAAELAGVHPQTLRMYERRGLIRPGRTAKNTRRYSRRDVERLQRIQQLTDMGLNLAGVKRVLAMEEELGAMAAEVERLHALLEAAADEMRREVERVEQAHRYELVPFEQTQIIPLGRRRRRF